MTVIKGSVENNSATRGGGLANVVGTVKVSDSSTFSSNSANNGVGIYDGSGSLTLSGSTLSKNSATTYGGGISSGGTVTVTGATLSGNTGRFGGGAYNVGTRSPTRISFAGLVHSRRVEVQRRAHADGFVCRIVDR